MLTEQEFQWLESRKNLCSRCVRFDWCRVGTKHAFNVSSCRYYEPSVRRTIDSEYRSPISDNYEDAAKFEARVATFLLICFMFPKCGTSGLCSEKCEKLRADGKLDPRWCRLKFARIMAEREEAEGE